MLRFQQLLDNSTRFKLLLEDLNSEEKDYLSQFCDYCMNPLYIFVRPHTTSYPTVVMSSDNVGLFEASNFYHFVPPTEPVLTNDQIFIMFLKSNRAHAAYLREYDPGYSSFDTEVDRRLSSAFSWASSNKGHPHWRKLDRKWHKMVTDLKLTDRT